MKIPFQGEYELDDDLTRVDFDRVQGWLAECYWSPGIGRDEVMRGARNSALVVGCYGKSGQAGFLRVASDKTRFGYFMDVYVDQKHRKKGMARGMMNFAMTHPELRDVYIWLLATKDAHGVYAQLGFAPMPSPEDWMIKRTPWERRPRAGGR